MVRPVFTGLKFVSP